MRKFKEDLSNALVCLWTGRLITVKKCPFSSNLFIDLMQSQSKSQQAFWWNLAVGFKICMRTWGTAVVKLVE